MYRPERRFSEFIGPSRTSVKELLLLANRRKAAGGFDPELLYVECQLCGKPVLWERGNTTELLLNAGVDITVLDERCLIVSEGCPACTPEAVEGYTLAVVRIAGLTPEEALHMSRPGGNC